MARESDRTYAREAAERGVREILLGTRGGCGVSFLPRSAATPVMFHDVLRLVERGGEVLGFRSEHANTRDARAALEDARLDADGAAWFRPFLERIARGEDFSLDELDAAHRALRGSALWTDRGSL